MRMILNKDEVLSKSQKEIYGEVRNQVEIVFYVAGCITAITACCVTRLCVQ